LNDARAAAAAAGLVLRSGSAHTGTVTGQSPAPGTRVSRGSAVTVTVAAAKPATPPLKRTGKVRLTWPWTLVPALTAAAALAMLARQGFRRRRRPPRPSPRLEVVRHRLTSEIHTSGTGSRPTRAVGLVPHPDQGSQVVQEARQ
jgi:hypothetical protein